MTRNKIDAWLNRTDVKGNPDDEEIYDWLTNVVFKKALSKIKRSAEKLEEYPKGKEKVC